MSKLSAPHPPPTLSSSSQTSSVSASQANGKGTKQPSSVAAPAVKKAPPTTTTKKEKQSDTKRNRQISHLKQPPSNEKPTATATASSSNEKTKAKPPNGDTTTTTTTKKSTKIEKVREDAQVKDKPRSPPSAAALARKKRKLQEKAREGKLIEIPEDASLPQMIKLVGRHKLFRGEKKLFEEQMNSATEKKQHAIPKKAISRIVRAILDENLDSSEEPRPMSKTAVQMLHEAAETEIGTIMHLANQFQLAAATIEQPWTDEDGIHHVLERPVLPGTVVVVKAATFRTAADTVAGNLGVWGRRDINNAVQPTNYRSPPPHSNMDAIDYQEISEFMDTMS